MRLVHKWNGKERWGVVTTRRKSIDDGCRTKEATFEAAAAAATEVAGVKGRG